MLKFYLTTVVIWMIIIYCTLFIFQDRLVKRGVLKKNVEKKFLSSKETLFVLFVLAAVPIIRLLVPVGFATLALCPQEMYDEIMRETKEEQDK